MKHHQMKTIDPDILDDMEAIRGIDVSDMLSRLVSFGQQCRQAMEIGSTVHLPAIAGAGITDIVVSGMGGSAIGGDLLRACLASRISVPIQVNRDLDLPGCVSSGSFLFIVSYSGNTEETLSAFDIALERGATLICITSGGHLRERAARHGQGLVLVPPGFPPRTALGYLLFPILVILERCGLIQGHGPEMDETIGWLERKAEAYRPAVPAAENQAKQVALQLHGRLPLVYASERFHPVARRWSTQINENAEQFVHVNVFPELGHNEIMCWSRLPREGEMFLPVFLRDRGDHPRVGRRMDLSANLLEKDGLAPLQVWGEGRSLLARMLSLICLGDFVSYYLAILRHIDPTPVERIDCLKTLLKQEVAHKEPVPKQRRVSR